MKNSNMYIYCRLLNVVSQQQLLMHELTHIKGNIKNKNHE